MPPPYTVRFEPLGLTIECDPAEPVLDSALRHGLRLVDYRCADGDCGGCKARVHSGQVFQRPTPKRVLSAAEQAQGQVLLCQTHGQSDLVIELLPGALLAPPAPSRQAQVAAALLGPLVAAADCLSDGLVVLDAQGRLVLVNRTAAVLLELDPAAPNLAALPELLALGRALLTHAASTPQAVKVYCPRRGRVLPAWGLALPPPTPAAVLLLPPPLTEPVLRKSKSVVVGAKYAFQDLVGQSAAFRQAIQIGLIAAGNSLSVLLAGESGTGKEMLAHAIHAGSPRAPQPFIAVNCGAIPRELIESELFGYEEGTFTGARKGGRLGRFEEAHGGTLFLDEVSECAPSTQVALLRVLQEQEITRLGSGIPRPIDVRIIAATNKDLLQEVAKGLFREDLYYRLNVLSIRLPPLRERREDLPLLAASFVAEVAEALHCPDLHFSEEALRGLARTPYPWPGNIRELRNVLQQVGALLSRPEIRWDDFPAAIRLGPGLAALEPAGGLAQAERQLIHQIVQQCAGNLSQAAAQLGISRSTLYRKLAQFGLKRQTLIDSVSDR